MPWGQSCQVECPKCRKNTRSKLGDVNQGGRGSIRRTRTCLECGSKFATYERVEELRPMPIGEMRDNLQAAYSKLALVLERLK